MARVKLIAQGELGVLSLNSFVKVLTNSLEILQSLDKRISEQSTGTIEWVITHLEEGSASVEIESKILHGDENHSSKILETFVDGIDHIESKGTTPPYFSLDDMTRIRNIVRQFGKNGLKGVGYSSQENNIRTELKPEIGESIEKLIGVHHYSLGAIEGTIEIISVRKNNRRCNIYHPITQRAIRCNLPEDYEKDIFKAAEEHRRVIITGKISYNVMGEPLKLQILKPLRFLKQEQDLPSVEYMLGKGKDMVLDAEG